ncbi:hypothetical protein [Cellulomonas chengniuliangii]|uniref:Uncharacterized protein n=1 Tax=Cellulomonas chengniuliangii TaxID=2968084 RepID=A0ABY5KYQ4_9CELL|nr:hypothetical protein [Cellulomonas chengniuliangii]MCC2307590.1 hypothetical protein [Cellulomonas chengniuliangii]UUI75642.1 hypothetical protein NP064_01590 [Cellulomonas chengniuliangii]
MFLPSLRVRAVALVLGIMGIALVIGLVSFGFAMTGSLLLAFVHQATDRFRAWLLGAVARRVGEPSEDSAASVLDTELPQAGLLSAADF